MRTEELNYHLPTKLIAQQPARLRSESRLLVLNRSNGKVVDSQFNRLGDFLSSGDCLILNDTKVLPARFFAQRGSGAKLEGLFLSENRKSIWKVLLKGSRKIKTGESFYLKDTQGKDFCQAVLLDKTDNGQCRLKIEKDAKLETILERIGFPPLPPYIRRTDDPARAKLDKLRYQTVYARIAGAVAAPTAGLHFTKQLIERLKNSGIRLAYITLHTGPGTFKPITSEKIEDHKIHTEQFCIDEKNARIINAAKQKNARVIAVGTTSVRTVETAASGLKIKPSSGTTMLFIKPGYKFKIVNAMITNFHLPKSTLLALVAAFAGTDNILAAYRHAITKRYRFYSYGDAMLII
jgi:S-adenosylmethionine:tRNA ribosyltransferase-isomerase